MIRRLVCCALVFAVLAACGDTGSSVSPPFLALSDSARAKSIVVQPSSVTLYEGDTLRFTAVVRDNFGAVISTAVARWQPSDGPLIRLDSTGLVTALHVRILGSEREVPSVTVSAKFGSVVGSATVIATGALNVWPDTNVLFVGMTRTLVSRVVHSSVGYPSLNIDIDTASSWSSSDPSVVTVNGGVISAAGVGHAKVFATLSDGHSRSAEVFVKAAPASPLQFTTVGTGLVLLNTIKTIGPYYDSRACGLATDGAAYCWGVATVDSDVADRCEMTARIGPTAYGLMRYRCTEIPVRMSASVSFSSLAVGGAVNCGIATAGRAYCWGSNEAGMLGSGAADTASRGVTAIASTDQFRSIHISDRPEDRYVCGVRTDGAAFCWGRGFSSTPAPLSGGVTWRSMAAAGRCGLSMDSTAYCISSTGTPTQTGTSRWAVVATDQNTRCALSTAGRVYCGLNLNNLAPGEPPLITVSNGASFPARNPNVCGLSATGDAYCADDVGPYTLRLMNLNGLKLKSIYGMCGIGIDNKAYCWSAIGGLTFKVVPGQ